MPTPVEMAVATYLEIWGEPDPALRTKLIEACFAPEGRLVTRSRDIVGHAAIAAEVSRIRADPQFVGVRLVSAVDAQRTTFRLRGVLERKDGTSPESFDAGEIDADGRISVLLTFAGPLGELSRQ